MTCSRMSLVAASLVALTVAGCSSTRFSTMNSQPEPLPAAPTGNVTVGQLPPPGGPGVDDPSAFPPAPGAEGTDVASIASADGEPPATARDVTKNAVVGSWSATAGGTSCQMFLTLTKYGNASRGGTRGCSGDLTTMRGWDVQGKQLVLYNDNGGKIAALYSSGESRFDGQTTSGQPVSLSR